MFGLGWGLSYGPNDSKTESYLTMWQWQANGKFGWSNQSLSGDMTLDDVKFNPVRAQSIAKPE